MTQFSFTGLGGTDEVGASCYLYRFTEGRLLIDAGLRPGRLGEAALPQLELLKDSPPDAIILTHAHLDHTAALPVVLRRFPKLRIEEGKLVVTLETATEGEIVERLNRIQTLDGVLAAALVFHHFEPAQGRG